MNEEGGIRIGWYSYDSRQIESSLNVNVVNKNN